MADGVVLDLYAEDLDKDFAGQAQVSQHYHALYVQIYVYLHARICMQSYTCMCNGGILNNIVDIFTNIDIFVCPCMYRNIQHTLFLRKG